jgi:hypothetical protein
MKAIPRPAEIKFLTALSVGRSVTKACEIAGIPRRTAYYWKSESPEFAEAWEDALETSVEELEEEVRRRALDPEDQKSAILLMFLLKKHRPEYRENYQQKKEVTIHHVQEVEFSKEEMATAIDILNSAKVEAFSDSDKADDPEATIQEDDKA